MKKSTIMIMLLLALILSAVAVWSYTTGEVSPVGIAYRTTDGNVNHSVRVFTEFDDNNTHNFTFYTDINGSWQINQTNSSATGNQSISFVVTNFDTAWDGTVQWNIKVTNSTNNFTWLFSSNQSYFLDVFAVRSFASEPANDTYTTTDQPAFNMSFNATDSPLSCTLYMSNLSGPTTFIERETKSDVVNNTVKAYGGAAGGWTIATEGVHRYYFNCTKVGSGISFNSDNATINYDATAPTITVTQPSSLSSFWSPDVLVNITVNTVDIFLSTCELYHNFNGSWLLNQTDITLSNDTGTNFSLINAGENSTGHTWGYVCNDTAGNRAVTNFTLFVDNTTVGAIDCVSPAKGTRSTDYRPTLGWTTTADTGFNRYELDVYHMNYSRFLTYNVTDNSTSTFEITDNLTTDTSYFWNISVVENNGFTNIGTNCTGGFNYTTDSVGHQLLEGYNFYSVVRNTVASQLGASGLCSEISTTPTSISRFNSSHAWESHVCGSASSNFSLNRDDAVVINMPSDGVWNVGRVWSVNTTVNHVNISNNSGTGWNLIGVNADRMLTQIDRANVNLSASGAAVATFDAPNETSTTTVTVNYNLTQSRLSAMAAVYNISVAGLPSLVPAGDYSVDLGNGIFTFGTNTTATNYSGSNLTFDYSYFDVGLILFMSYPNQTLSYVPFKYNWSYNGAVNVFDGVALWLNINDTIVTSVQYNRSLW